MPDLQMAGLAHLLRLNDHWFRLDEPLVSSFVERWHSELHTFHMPFGECTIILQDVVYQLELSINEQYETFSDLSHGVDEETVRRYVRAYITMLLSTQLFGNKSGTRMHIRWLPYVARLEDMGRYSWGSTALSWLYQCLCRVANKHMVVRLSANIERERTSSRALQTEYKFTRVGISPDVVKVMHPEILESRHTALWRRFLMPELFLDDSRVVAIPTEMFLGGIGQNPDLDQVLDVPNNHYVERKCRVGKRSSQRE
ncbi:hypothetical protein Ahy_A07g032335 [Arachis hypogaea]|uniref:Aminotransferase-like plant mobile domain-containing protein n=1 Tax=Arachis hypogaea TaxID=3818 RepID=A0A445C6V7_ARAHY|nr:hypothetical protein Ahy_A07g032335 [Arachis hypogaea]